MFCPTKGLFQFLLKGPFLQIRAAKVETLPNLGDDFTELMLPV